jgi:Domain of unknown function (DUF927)
MRLSRFRKLIKPRPIDNDAEATQLEYRSFGNFVMDNGGLFYVETKTNDDGHSEEKRTWLASAFEVLAQTRDTASQAWGKLLRWRDPDRHVHEWAMPTAMLGGDRRDLSRELLGGGLDIASSQSARNKLGDYLASVRVSDRARAVDRVGWHTIDGHTIFVLPDQTFGNAGEGVFLQTERRVRAPYRVAGTVEAWRDEAGRLCIGNSRLALMVSYHSADRCCSIRANAGAACTSLDTVLSASVILLIAGSVWGGGEINGYCCAWRATSNGLRVWQPNIATPSCRSTSRARCRRKRPLRQSICSQTAWANSAPLAPEPPPGRLIGACHLVRTARSRSLTSSPRSVGGLGPDKTARCRTYKAAP